MQVKLIGGRRDGLTFQVTHLVPELYFPAAPSIREVYRLNKLNPNGEDEYVFVRTERVDQPHR